MARHGVSRAAADIAAADRHMDVLKQASAGPLARFAEGLGRLVDEELQPLFDALAEAFLGNAAEMPNELKVSFVADVVNRSYEPLRASLVRATSKNPKLCLAVGEEAMGELKVDGRIASSSHAKVECGVEWTAPAATPEVKAAAAAMTASQAAAVKLLQAGCASGGGGTARRQQLMSVGVPCSRWSRRTDGRARRRCALRRARARGGRDSASSACEYC